MIPLAPATHALANLLLSLDRCPHGRHAADPCHDCPDGHSTGNPLLPPGTHIGYTVHGDPIRVPPPDHHNDPHAWRQRNEDATPRDHLRNPDGTPTITLEILAARLDDAQPYPIQLDPAILRYMARQLLGMFTLTPRPGHPVWQPDDDEPDTPPPPPLDPDQA